MLRGREGAVYCTTRQGASCNRDDRMVMNINLILYFKKKTISYLWIQRTRKDKFEKNLKNCLLNNWLKKSYSETNVFVKEDNSKSIATDPNKIKSKHISHIYCIPLM